MQVMTACLANPDNVVFLVVQNIFYYHPCISRKVFPNQENVNIFIQNAVRYVVWSALHSILFNENTINGRSGNSFVDEP